jgi:hypothetical protein
MAIGTFLFGEDPSKVQITDPALVSAAETRKKLRERYQKQLAGGPTAGETAIMEAAETGVETMGEQARAAAGGTRGFARLAALSDANRLANVGAQRILGGAATAAGAQRAQDLASAEAGLMNLGAADIQQFQLEEELKKRRAKPGALGILGTMAGMGIGAATGGPSGAIQGGQLGGALGTGFQRLGRAMA